MQRLLLSTPTCKRLAAWTLTTLLVACGGGGGGDSSPGTGAGTGTGSNTGGSTGGGGSTGTDGGTVTPPTPQVTTVSVALSQPGAGEVFSVGTALPLRAEVRADGVLADNGTSVQFTASTGQSTMALTSAGTASASLAGLEAGRRQVQASATVSDRTGTASQTVYLRPAPAALQVLVPAYFHPSGAGATAWSAMTASAAAGPAGQITAILNPSNGIFSTADTSMLRAATAFTNAGGRLIGYVSSSYGTGTRPLASIQANIDAYLALYGTGVVKGFFIDEMASQTARLDFYRAIYRYIKAKNPDLLVVGNPGLIPAGGYADVADVLTTFEGKASTYADYDPRTTASEWLYTLPNSRQASLVHNASSCTGMQSAVQSAASGRYQAGWIYVTHLEYEPSTGVGNPWAGLPSYWDSFLQTVRSTNAGQPMPACT